MVRDVAVRDKPLSPFTALAPQVCQLAQVTSQSLRRAEQGFSGPLDKTRRSAVGMARLSGQGGRVGQDQHESLHPVAGASNDETAVGTTTCQTPIARPEKESADDSLEDSADAMVAVECARENRLLDARRQSDGKWSRDDGDTRLSNVHDQDETVQRAVDIIAQQAECGHSDSALSNQRGKGPAVNSESSIPSFVS